MQFLLDRVIAATLGLMFGALLGLVVTVFMHADWSMAGVRDLIAWDGPVKYCAIAFAIVGLVFGESAGTALGVCFSVFGRLLFGSDSEPMVALPRWLHITLVCLLVAVLAWTILT